MWIRPRRRHWGCVAQRAMISDHPIRLGCDIGGPQAAAKNSCWTPPGFRSASGPMFRACSRQSFLPASRAPSRRPWALGSRLHVRTNDDADGFFPGGDAAVRLFGAGVVTFVLGAAGQQGGFVMTGVRGDGFQVVHVGCGGGLNHAFLRFDFLVVVEWLEVGNFAALGRQFSGGLAGCGCRLAAAPPALAAAAAALITSRRGHLLFARFRLRARHCCRFAGRSFEVVAGRGLRRSAGLSCFAFAAPVFAATPPAAPTPRHVLWPRLVAGFVGCRRKLRRAG